MKLDKVKKLAARILGTGQNAIWLNPDETAKLAESMTKDDVRKLIKDGLIKKRIAKGHSRGKARMLHGKKKKGRKRGFGKKRGTKKARAKKREAWIRGVRAQRKILREAKAKKIKMKAPYRKIYRMIKGGYFKGKKYVKSFAESGKI